eukprot:8379727-Pyramimonas_sp.AAC.1
MAGLWARYLAARDRAARPESRPTACIAGAPRAVRALQRPPWPENRLRITGGSGRPAPMARAGRAQHCRRAPR